jgi:hypothetical protein
MGVGEGGGGGVQVSPPRSGPEKYIVYRLYLNTVEDTCN